MKVRSSTRVGDLILVIGMVGRDGSGMVVDGVRAQTACAFERVRGVLAEYGRDLGAVVRMRIYLTDMADWPAVREEVTAAVGEEWPPAVVVQVAALVEPSMQVELEVDASAA